MEDAIVARSPPPCQGDMAPKKIASCVFNLLNIGSVFIFLKQSGNKLKICALLTLIDLSLALFTTDGALHQSQRPFAFTPIMALS